MSDRSRCLPILACSYTLTPSAVPCLPQPGRTPTIAQLSLVTAVAGDRLTVLSLTQHLAAYIAPSAAAHDLGAHVNAPGSCPAIPVLTLRSPSSIVVFHPLTMPGR